VDLLDLAHYERVRQPAGEVETPPAWRHTAPELHARPAAHVFTPGWHLVAGADELSEPGSDLAVDAVPGPVLLRAGEGRPIDAIANSCRHAVHRLDNRVLDQALDEAGRRRAVVAG
jgi:hypothetical protein